MPIMLKRTDLGFHQRQKISSKSLKGPAGIALPRGGDVYCFLVSAVFSMPGLQPTSKVCSVGKVSLQINNKLLEM